MKLDDLKLKAWIKPDKITKTPKGLVDIFRIDFSLNFPLTYMDYLSGTVSVKKDCFELSRFTGKKDTTDEEIYEGHIVELITSKFKEDRYRIFYDEDKSCFALTPLVDSKNHMFDYAIMDSHICNKLLVVGIIWDHPELLGDN